MSIPGQVELERIRSWQGQRLRGRDFRDMIAGQAQLHWWHNRALHNVFGVRYGFAVTPVTVADALAGVEVGCGVAYDCHGRELILQSKRTIQLPASPLPKASKMTLVARYKEAAEFPARSERSVLCASAPEAPAFLWKRSSNVQVTDGVPIARLSYESTAELERLPAGTTFPDSLAGKISYNDKRQALVFKGEMSDDEQQQLLNLSSEQSFQDAVKELFQKSKHLPVPDETFYAPRARPLARPRIGTGMTSQGHTAWELWSEKVLGQRRVLKDEPIGMQVTIDTSAAGFTETPNYFAWLEGSLWDQPNIEFFPVPLTHIDNASAKKFRFRIWMPNIITILGGRLRIANEHFTTEFLNFARSKNLHVCWLGIQCVGDVGCDEIEECSCETVNEV